MWGSVDRANDERFPVFEFYFAKNGFGVFGLGYLFAAYTFPSSDENPPPPLVGRSLRKMSYS